ncbi:aspartate carbamoyltransferase catalytic subunit [Virgibacillus halodenitrificans]|uniref:Aspartate carbamoyltransferase n=1 Tax=Virgibacillus halodenitrificans TaxID=1482 RepID=A0AAC9NL77_VIRHA|nr:aspartate carbamoyltransferase catalytic subunit [Virgibacillus halodenitrificans]APC48698.1 aspartate carbamoyltransferase [Virgibacillus halodenitrificans]MCG1028631.1 aspartate carbamoyltransferase catalytic subunit [Virgibacillus halodenitrificans]MCJ0931275.1 aspartate carbamoyltransferase catalytic subunit [Virgibacillus halodenitrificans]MEC2160230.1 aspartate carbamoyltransferase catalytic subunit [Virgibacillus halodenitrificans]CDQ35917.1 Aspartate carbamoyltransferase [Virgibacil
MRHFISVNQLSVKEIHSLLDTAESLRNENKKVNDQIFAANLFFEPSTRTKMSFIVAQRKLGLEVLDLHEDISSTRKGETLYDTAKTFESIGANLLIVRHHADTWFEDLQDQISIPIINGGAGKAEHPTQCLLDLLTLYQEFGRLRGLNVVIVGDIKHSRVARSNANALKRLGAKVSLCAAPGFEDHSLDFPYITIDEATKKCDALMLLRIQHERHTTNSFIDDYLKNYGLTKEREKRMQKHAIILHPAPINRGVEIDSDLVECERSRIFKQMNNGVYIRMAIMIELLQEWGLLNENIIEKREKTVVSV